ncbi:PLP-dependent aminotransferase family protein [Pseudomonas sp. GD03944]|uniref:MocR-like pyridoxine biosynthesis transcription factor PdxR n=1 Tax=Pseudomonas sp. GD03944 TaxID=2975409 RepID=UPI002449CDFE|nr:PLP-dependent aminotransferase family protein [Pseudomonas sp. GD03944]MDH1263817.1 PLP-dependent aminotransferase family protein [Pseudomonas sp. GD03944]
MTLKPTLSLEPAGIRLDPRKGLAQQLYQALRERILDGRMASRMRLPASRDLARALGVSRNTVVRAYDQLYAEGFIDGRIGDGTYVAALGEGVPASPERVPVPIPEPLRQRLSLYGPGTPREGPPLAFRLGLPAMDLFPFDIWARLQAQFWRSANAQQLGYGNPAGEPRLRELIAAYLRNSRGLRCTPEQVVITSGAQQAISLCTQLLVQSGDGVALESPCYRAAAQAFAVAGARLCGVEVDEDGMDTARLESLSDCRLAYVTPSHQYPTGVTLSLARRLELLDWASRREAWIIEDDYDGEYRYSGSPLAPLASLDQQGRVLYVGTFSKVIFPALRLGYLVVPPVLVKPLAQLRALGMRHSDIGSQMVLADFIAQGHFQRHIRRMRRAARFRRDALLAGWPADLAGALPEVQAGLHVCMPLESPAREQVLMRQAAAVGVEVSGLSDFWQAPVVEQAPRAGLVLGFAGVDEPQIETALAALRGAWRQGV